MAILDHIRAYTTEAPNVRNGRFSDIGVMSRAGRGAVDALPDPA